MKMFRSILIVVLSVLVLVSSSHFYVGLHSCLGRVNSVAFLEKADGCGHAKMPPCHQKLMKDCCDDESISHDATGFKADFFKVGFTSPVSGDILYTSSLVAEVIPDSPIARIKFLNYDTPLPSFDRTVLHQVFLI